MYIDSKVNRINIRSIYLYKYKNLTKVWTAFFNSQSRVCPAKGQQTKKGKKIYLCIMFSFRFRFFFDSLSNVIIFIDNMLI